MPSVKVYTSRDVSKLLDLTVQQIRSYAREGFLEPDRGPRGELRFSFQDLVLLRTAAHTRRAAATVGEDAHSDARRRRGDTETRVGIRFSAATRLYVSQIGVKNAPKLRV